MLYYTEKYLDLKKTKTKVGCHFNLQSKQYKFRLFGELECGCLAWLPRMIFYHEYFFCVYFTCTGEEN